MSTLTHSKGVGVEGMNELSPRKYGWRNCVQTLLCPI